MHGFSEDNERLAEAVLKYALDRMRLDPVPLDGPRPYQQIYDALGETITAAGIGGERAQPVVYSRRSHGGVLVL